MEARDEVSNVEVKVEDDLGIWKRSDGRHKLVESDPSGVAPVC